MLPLERLCHITITTTITNNRCFISFPAMLEYIAFLSCLEFAVLNSLYGEFILKPKQVLCLESLYMQKDVMCVLPTGYGKSLIFHLLPLLLYAKFKLQSDLLCNVKRVSAAAVNSIVVVVSPLNALMSDQIQRLRMSGIRASVIKARESEGNELADNIELEENINEKQVDIDFWLCEESKLRNGHYHIVFAHPESLISSNYGRELLLSELYQENVVAIVIDEAHCIVDW